MGRLFQRGLIATVVIWLLATPAALAQQYEDETGSLDLEISVTVEVTLSGEGYVADSVVYITLSSSETDDDLDLGTLPLDEQGRFFGEITIPEGLEPAIYTLSATGVTSQGATRVLSAPLTIGQEALELVPAETTTTSASSTTVTTRRDRGSGLDPIEVSAPDTTDSNPFDRILLARVLTVALVALGGVWWWLYRAAKG